MLRAHHDPPPIHDRDPRGVSPASRLSLLGAFEVVHAGHDVELTLPAQRLLAYLALRRRPVHRDHAAEELWLDSSQSHALGSLRSALWRLRQPRCELVRVRGCRLELSPQVDVDLHEAQAWMRRMLDASDAGASLDLRGFGYGGELLPDWYDDWVVFERERFRLLWLHALDELCDRLTVAGSFARALEAALLAVQADPLRESSNRALIRVHLCQGNVADAVGQYRRFSGRLDRELGLMPSTQMRDLIVSAQRG